MTIRWPDRNKREPDAWECWWWTGLYCMQMPIYMLIMGC